MAITSADINNQSFSMSRKGYDTDEVDVFLEHVASEIDALNTQIEQLEDQSDDNKFDGFDTSVTSEADETADEEESNQEFESEKDAVIAELQRQLEDKKADDNAIAQALIIAQRSADEILTKANAEATSIIKDAEIEAQRIVDKAENEKRRVLDSIRKLETDREGIREDYRDLLNDIISDATRKMAEIGATVAPIAVSATHAREVQVVEAGDTASNAPVDATQSASDEVDGAGAYAVPLSMTGVVATPVIPKPASVEKDLSGFGDADDDFEFEEID